MQFLAAVGVVTNSICDGLLPVLQLQVTTPAMAKLDKL
jgi:hypothetical protein